MIWSAISGISSSKRRRTKSGWVRLRMILTRWPTLRTSRMTARTRSPGWLLSPGICSERGRRASVLPRLTVTAPPSKRWTVPLMRSPLLVLELVEEAVALGLADLLDDDLLGGLGGDAAEVRRVDDQAVGGGLDDCRSRGRWRPGCPRRRGSASWPPWPAPTRSPRRGLPWGCSCRGGCYPRCGPDRRSCDSSEAAGRDGRPTIMGGAAGPDAGPRPLGRAGSGLSLPHRVGEWPARCPLGTDARPPRNGNDPHRPPRNRAGSSRRIAGRVDDGEASRPFGPALPTARASLDDGPK